MLKTYLDCFIADLIAKRKHSIRLDVLINKNVIMNYYKKGFSLQILHQYLMDNKNLKKCSFKEFVDAVFIEIDEIKEFEYTKLHIENKTNSLQQEEQKKEDEDEYSFLFCLKKRE